MGLLAFSEEKKPDPGITDAQRAGYWQAVADLTSAQAAADKAQLAVQATVTDLRATCEKSGRDLTQGADRQPVCVAKPAPPKPEAPPKK